MVFKIPGLRYDPDDLDLLLCRAWCTDAYGYVRNGKGTLHRQIAERVLGRKMERHEIIDHINGDRLDYRRSNLRVVTQAQNGHNRIRARKDNKTGMRGVTWHEGRRKYRVQGWDRHRLVFYFETPDRAEAEEKARQFNEDRIRGLLDNIPTLRDLTKSPG